VVLFANTMAFDCRFILAHCVARRTNSALLVLLAPCDPGDSAISIGHRIYEQDHLAAAVDGPDMVAGRKVLEMHKA